MVKRRAKSRTAPPPFLAPPSAALPGGPPPATDDLPLAPTSVSLAPCEHKGPCHPQSRASHAPQSHSNAAPARDTLSTDFPSVPRTPAPCFVPLFASRSVQGAGSSDSRTAPSRLGSPPARSPIGISGPAPPRDGDNLPAALPGARTVRCAPADILSADTRSPLHDCWSAFWRSV